jgi:enamine deaminase RidA (YjgF/YER057c/UK114 family)
MLQKFNPESTYPSFTVYSQGVQVPPGARWLYTSGQVGVNPDGSLAGDSEAQFERAWLNVLAILEAADMGAEDLVKVNTYITHPKYVDLNCRYRDRFVKDAGPAATNVIVARLSYPEWVVEIEAVAAKV